jgi:hypothetical protein
MDDSVQQFTTNAVATKVDSQDMVQNLELNLN